MVSFVSVHQAIGGERVLQGTGISVLALPTPREIDISCGQCLIFSSQDEAQILKLWEEARVEWSRLFSRDGQKRIYKEIRERK